jgi:hypothetical protein
LPITEYSTVVEIETIDEECSVAESELHASFWWRLSRDVMRHANLMLNISGVILKCHKVLNSSDDHVIVNLKFNCA